MSVLPGNFTRLDLRRQRQPRATPILAIRSQTGRHEQRDHLHSLETLSSRLSALKATLAQAIVSYSQACVSAGQPDLQAQLSTRLRPVKTLKAGMHRLARAMTANQPR